MYPTEVIEYMMNRTSYKARQVVRRIPALDVEDVQHDLIADVLHRLPKFNGDRASVKTFICRIINNKIADLIKSHDAESRGNGCTHESLDDWVHDETGTWVRRDTTVEESRLRAHRGVTPRDGQEQRDLEVDMADTIAGLPPKEQALCARLSAESPTEVSRATGSSRSGIYKAIAAIRAAFIKAHLHLYV